MRLEARRAFVAFVACGAIAAFLALGACGGGLGRFAGPGLLTQRDPATARVVVSALSPHSSADEAGIAIDDEIEAIDGHEVKAMTALEVHERLHGKRGSAITLRVRRGDVSREILIEREPVE